MKFEFDPAKSAGNLHKHGIDFEKAQKLWNDEQLLIAAARTEIERRYIAVGVIDGLPWCAVFTLRGEAIRLISVRRARADEVERYEESRKNN